MSRLHQMAARRRLAEQQTEGQTDEQGQNVDGSIQEGQQGSESGGAQGREESSPEALKSEEPVT